jgi:hypothetical protein
LHRLGFDYFPMIQSYVLSSNIAGQKIQWRLDANRTVQQVLDVPMKQKSIRSR